MVTLTTVVLGGFRGLIVDLLWMRLITAQAGGKVFEIAQLADWITRLEPEFTEVWAFHAWNMAYNISVLYSSPEHRWQWVENGIRLLRDNGLRFNPRNPILYKELGWIYQHKIGQDWDDMHLYYKARLAREMNDLFGGARLAPSAAGPALEKMRGEYKLVPEIMRAVENEYGELDWRLPETHALYWAFRGKHAAAPGKDTADCDHMLFQALAAAFRQGKLFFDPAAGIYVTTPQISLLPGARKAYAQALERNPGGTVKAACLHFLSEAVFILHAYGLDPEAEKIFAEITRALPGREESFEKFIRHYDRLDITGLPLPDAVALIEGRLYQSHCAARAGAKEKSQELRKKALRDWEKYAQSRRRDLPDFQLIDQQARKRQTEVNQP